MLLALLIVILLKRTKARLWYSISGHSKTNINVFALYVIVLDTTSVHVQQKLFAIFLGENTINCLYSKSYYSYTNEQLWNLNR